MPGRIPAEQRSVPVLARTPQTGEEIRAEVCSHRCPPTPPGEQPEQVPRLPPSTVPAESWAGGRQLRQGWGAPPGLARDTTLEPAWPKRSRFQLCHQLPIAGLRRCPQLPGRYQGDISGLRVPAPALRFEEPLQSGSGTHLPLAFGCQEKNRRLCNRSPRD